MIDLFQSLNPVSCLEELLLTEPEVWEIRSKAIGDDLVFDDVIFAHDGDQQVLSDISLTILQGQKIAFVDHLVLGNLLWFACRLSTIVDADCIDFLENHQITGRAIHQGLLENQETYAHFVRE